MIGDCAACGSRVRPEIDGDGTVREVCTGKGCGISQKPHQGPLPRAEIRAHARQVVALARRQGLPLMRCPSCKQDWHDRCHASGCECVKGEHPLRPSLEGLALLAAETPGHLDPTDLPEED